MRQARYTKRHIADCLIQNFHYMAQCKLGVKRQTARTFSFLKARSWGNGRNCTELHAKNDDERCNTRERIPAEGTDVMSV